MARNAELGHVAECMHAVAHIYNWLGKGANT